MHARDRSGWGVFWPLLIPLILIGWGIDHVDSLLGINFTQIGWLKQWIHYGMWFFFGVVMVYLKEWYREYKGY